MTSSNWTIDNIPDQSGRIIIITGANSGIGFEAAKVLAAKSAEVILAVRNQEKGDLAKTRIIKNYPEAKVQVMLLDLADLKSVQAFCTAFVTKYKKLDILINNAGIMIPPYGKTVDGFESQFGTNHLGHFALTAQLFDLLKDTSDSRIVNLSSTAHKMGNPNFEDLNWEKRKYVAWKAYGDSKIANLYFTYALTEIIKNADLEITVTAAHPGYAATELQKSLWLKILNVLMAQSGSMGALPTLMAAIDPDAKSGNFYGPSGFAQQRGYPKEVLSNKLSYDAEIASRLWAVSEEMTGVKFQP
ncbi:SDR family NAD(P)-dependent oxidoreductase [bacterium]|nr:SDR family NAD(P)-dependent oxidoreductase [bacterium]